MRRLLPLPVEQIDRDDLYADLADVPSWVALGMVASVDGGATDAEGTSGGLGGEGDLMAFRALRAVCDVVLVGAGTARAERYGPARLTEAQRRRRHDRGQAPEPVVAVVTRSLDLDGAEALWEGDRAPTIVTTTSADREALQRLRERGCDVVLAGEEDVDPRAAVVGLRERGLPRVLCEGGPGLNGALLAADVVDRVHVTVAPLLVGGDAGRIVAGPAVAHGLRLVGVREHDGDLVLAYERSRD